MHYSDCYTLVKNLKDKNLAMHLKSSLKELEKAAREPSFIAYLNYHTDKSLLELRKEYDLHQLKKVVDDIKTILNELPNDNIDPVKLEIQTVLLNVKQTIKNQIRDYDSFTDYSDYFELAKKYATHYIPFNHANDPLKGPDFVDYSWGHSHRYGELAAKEALQHLSLVSDKKLYNRFKTNWTFADVLFRRVGWYFSVNQEAKIRQALWDALKQLDDKAIFNVNFAIGTKAHSTSLRMVGDGIEYYENNYGLVRFESRESAVNFLTAHLLNRAVAEKDEISSLAVFKLPYTNIVEHDVFADLPQALIKKNPGSISETEKAPVHPELRETIDALEGYAGQLKKQSDIKAKIKAKEISCLVQELNALPTDKIKQRVSEILDNKAHSLMINRGSGLYFFKTHFKSHSTTESLLQNIQTVALTL